MIRDRKHIAELDGVRGIAILIVLWGHLRVPLLTMKAPTWFHAGVDLFFLLSGFLIARILLYNREQRIPLRQFYWRRAARILPAALLTVGVVACFWPSYSNVWAATYLLNIQSLFGPRDLQVPINHFWSLCVEEQFYLVFPAIAVFSSVTWGRRICVLGCCLGCGLMLAAPYAIEILGLESTATQPWIRNQLWTRGWMLLLGAVFAYGEIRLRSRPLELFAITCALPVIALTIFYLNKENFNTSVAIRTITNQIGIATIFSFALWCSFNQRASFLTDPALRFCGQISYGLYLYHLPIYFVVRSWKPDPLEMVIFSIVPSFAVAIFSFHFFERPIVQWARRFEFVANDLEPMELKTADGTPAGDTATRLSH